MIKNIYIVPVSIDYPRGIYFFVTESGYTYNIIGGVKSTNLAKRFLNVADFIPIDDDSKINNLIERDKKCRLEKYTFDGMLFPNYGITDITNSYYDNVIKIIVVYDNGVFYKAYVKTKMGGIYQVDRPTKVSKIAKSLKHKIHVDYIEKKSFQFIELSKFFDTFSLENKVFYTFEKSV